MTVAPAHVATVTNIEVHGEHTMMLVNGIRPSPATCHQRGGLWIVVPGMGLGSWLAFSIQVRTGFTKSACCLSCHDVLRVGAPGVTKPISLLFCNFTSRRDSAKSEPFETMTAQSYAFCQASLSTCRARFTSEPFSSFFHTLTDGGGGLAFSIDTQWRRKCP